MSEAKVFEGDGFVVTTARFVYGNDVVPIDNIEMAMPFVDRPWLGTVTIGAIGLGMLIWGGVVSKIIGFLLLPGAYYFYQSVLHRALLVALHSGDSISVKVTSADVLQKLYTSINDVVESRKRAQADALRADLDALPAAQE